MKRAADWDAADTASGVPGCEQANGASLFPELLASTCHAKTPLTKFMALYDTFKLIALNEVGMTLADSMLKLIGTLLGDLGEGWWPLSLAEL